MPSTRQLPALVLSAAIVLAALAYWVGLRGPFLFDDGPNLSMLGPWLEGDAGLREVVFPTGSWLTDRSVAMGSFALNAALGGMAPFGFKLVNLMLHLLCGLLAYKVVAMLLARDPVLSSRNRVAAAVVAAIWLLHPFNASTVLYVVQRMTQLAALACLAGLWFYIDLRQRMEQRALRHGWLLLSVGIGALTILGVMCKQNAAVLPLLCLVVELAYFQRPRQWPRGLVIFYGLFLLVPAALVTAVLAFKPDALLAGYGEYAFSPIQRLLSEGRVLVDYLRMIVAPFTPAMGVYTDDYAASTGLFAPPATALAIGALILISALAWRARRAMPSVFAGWFLFLAAHAVESTILPLELYYEHRNYLPMLGVLISCAGLVAALGARAAKADIRVGRVGVVVAIALVAMLAVLTHGRARVWSDGDVLAEAAVRSHPDSRRAVINLMGKALETGKAGYADALAARTLETSRNPETLSSVGLFRIRVRCDSLGRASVADLDQAVTLLPAHIDLISYQMLQYVGDAVDQGRCEGITSMQMANALVRAADGASSQSDDAWPKERVRQIAARRFAREGRWDLALTQARLSWRPHSHPALAPILIQALVHEGHAEEARRVYDDAVGRVDRNEPDAEAGLRELKNSLAGPAP